MKSICVPIVGIVAAALLDNRFSWGTAASVLVALYCHRLYRRPPTPVSVCACSSDEPRPGWAARWGASGRRDPDRVRPKWSEVG